MVDELKKELSQKGLELTLESMDGQTVKPLSSCSNGACADRGCCKILH
jgi:hypothetical protein